MIKIIFLALLALSIASYAADPTTTASASSNGTSYSFGTWAPADVSVTLTCVPGSSDCASISYCLDTTNTCDPTSGGSGYSAPVDVSTEGVSYIRYASQNSTGGWGSASSGQIEIDTTPPVVTITADATSSWTNDMVIQASADDGNGSGVVQTRWVVTGDSTCDGSLDSQLDSGSSGLSADANQDSVYQGQYICFRATDAVGNRAYAESSQMTTLDTTPPNVSAGPDRTANSQFTQQGQVSDSGSGVATYSWSEVSGPGSVSFGSPDAATTTVSAGADGDYVIKLEGTDLAGNTASATFNLVWETAPPMISVVNPDTSPSKSKEVTASASKGTLYMSLTSGSGCDSSQSFVPYSPENLTTESDNGDRVCFRAMDDAGNVAYQLSSQISGIDTTKPVITLNGPQLMDVEALSSFTDPGATATDKDEGDISSRMSVRGSVNASRSGPTTSLTMSATRRGMPPMRRSGPWWSGIPPSR